MVKTVRQKKEGLWSSAFTSMTRSLKLFEIIFTSLINLLIESLHLFGLVVFSVELLQAFQFAHLWTHLMECCGDGFGWSITAKHVALQHTAILITRHEGKVPECTTHTQSCQSGRTDDEWTVKFINRSDAEEAVMYHYESGVLPVPTGEGGRGKDRKWQLVWLTGKKQKFNFYNSACSNTET